jgi:methylmalonyl-CoA mutase N-terminal domain/subunit
MAMAERTSPSGLPIDEIYTSPDATEVAGEYPFTRGVHPTMYRGRTWTMRQYAGFGTASDTNKRFRDLLAAGQTGLSVAFDLPTQMGYDSDDRLAAGEVGRVGVAIDSVDDMAELFREISLDQVSTSMTINSTASILLAMYVVVAEESGIDRKDLRGTIQNDVLKEYIARGTYIFPVDPSLRLITDTFRFITDEEMSFNPISVSGYHMREAGSTAPQEIAFTFANGKEYLDRARDVGLDINKVARRLSFFFASHNDLFEEAAKFRAARRLWARIMKERYEVEDENCRMRFHTQTGGSTLTAQQPENNIVRVAVQSLAAILGGTQSLHSNAFDEALALPSAESARLALRTQQVLAQESGTTQTVDPLGGSFYVEALTDRLEAEAVALLEEVEEIGGSAAAIDRGYFQDAISRAAYDYQKGLETGAVEVVGVNTYQEDEAPRPIPTPDYGKLAVTQTERLSAVRKNRDQVALKVAMDALAAGAKGEARMMPLMIEAVRARATVGEICSVLRTLWGTFKPPV